MFQYRHVLVRMRQGDSDRDIARSRLMGRRKVAGFRALVGTQGWLNPDAPLPDDAAVAALIGAPRRARSTISTVEPYRPHVEQWAAQVITSPFSLFKSKCQIKWKLASACNEVDHQGRVRRARHLA
jgi:hypothetical protein